MILGIETSCDESAVALFDPHEGILGEWIHSQIALHGKHGGVVPDLATREHLRHLEPLLVLARDHAGFTDVSEIAVTRGPGLAACLAIGMATAKALSVAKGIPVVGVNHLRAHAHSPFIPLHASDPRGFEVARAALLPHLGLIVSGGNTLLCSLGLDLSLSMLASTRDDAAGEALDKGAKLLGLGYPGGPKMEQVAKAGNPSAYDFPRGLGRGTQLDFSFSGLKTSLRYQIEKMTLEEVQARLPDLCASYQEAVIDALGRKLELAFARCSYASIGLSGGVSNNEALRERVGRLGRRTNRPVLLAEPWHTGDNAGMIAFASWADPNGTNRPSGLSLDVAPALPLDAL